MILSFPSLPLPRLSPQLESHSLLRVLPFFQICVTLSFFFAPVQVAAPWWYHATTSFLCCPPSSCCCQPRPCCRSGSLSYFLRSRRVPRGPHCFHRRAPSPPPPHSRRLKGRPPLAADGAIHTRANRTPAHSKSCAGEARLLTLQMRHFGTLFAVCAMAFFFLAQSCRLPAS